MELITSSSLSALNSLCCFEFRAPNESIIVKNSDDNCSVLVINTNLLNGDLIKRLIRIARPAC